jgi:hypothetical protein
MSQADAFKLARDPAFIAMAIDDGPIRCFLGDAVKRVRFRILPWPAVELEMNSGTINAFFAGPLLAWRLGRALHK